MRFKAVHGEQPHDYPGRVSIRYMAASSRVTIRPDNAGSSRRCHRGRGAVGPTRVATGVPVTRGRLCRSDHIVGTLEQVHR